MKTVELHTSGTKRTETWRGGVKWWKLTIDLAVASGGEREKAKEDYHRRRGHSRCRAPAWVQNDTSVSGRKYRWHLDGHKIFEYTLYSRQYWYSSKEQTAVSVCSNRQEERNGTTSQRRRQTGWNLVRVGKVVRVGHRQGGGVERCSSGVVWEINSVSSEFSESRRTHTQSFRISAGEAFRSMACEGIGLYASYFALMSCFASYWIFPEGLVSTGRKTIYLLILKNRTQTCFIVDNIERDIYVRTRRFA